MDCKFRRTDRTGLYILIIIALFMLCDIQTKVKKIEGQVKELKVTVDSLKWEK